MKTIIAGSRDLTNRERVFEMLDNHDRSVPITEVVSGGARGIDSLGELWGNFIKKVPIKRFPAYWNLHGKAAGFIRNQEMADYADALVAIWDGKSRGTQDMVKRATEAGLKTYVYLLSHD